MKPYFRLRALAVFSVVLLVLIALPSEAKRAKAQVNKSVTAKMVDDATTRAGFEHFYNMEYDAAIRNFEQVAEQHPDDPFAVNHLLTGVMFKELYRIGALDSELYAKNDFLTSKQFPIDGKVRTRIRELMDRAQRLTDKRLKENPDDVDALYARGVTKGLRSTYAGLVEKAWLGALRSAIGARRDHEHVLELDPKYADAKFIVGVHNYIVGSVSWAMKVAAAIVGLSGSKQKGLEYLNDAALHGAETTVDAKITLSLFLRREQRYGDCLSIVSALSERYPKSFLLGLEHANLLNASGRGPEAIAAYRKLAQNARAGMYYQPRLEQIAWGLGEALRGQRDFSGAIAAYESILSQKDVDPELNERATLATGEVYDMMLKRDLAVERYRAVIAADANSWRADLARKYLKQPYRGQKG